MRIWAIYFVLMLSACGSQPPKALYEKGAKIGLVEYSFDSEFCHENTALTAFQNSSQSFEIPLDILSVMASSIKNIAQRNGHSAILVREPSLVVPITDLFEFSSWGGNPAARPGTNALLKESASLHDLDIILFTSIANLPDSGKKCSVRYSTNSVSDSGIIYSKQYLLAFDVKSGAYLGTNLGVGGELVPPEKVKNLKGLTQKDVNALVTEITSGIENGFKDLFKELGLGEQGYFEVQYM